MDLTRMIADLQEERRRLDEAIEALERLAVGQTRRRGRPPRSSSSAAMDSEASADRVDATRNRLKKLHDRT